MSSVIVTVHLQAKSQEARDEILELIYRTVESAKTENGTLRYVVCLPIDTNDKTSIYMTEHYASEADFQLNMGSDTVKHLLSFLGPDSELITAPPDLHVLPPSASYQRSGVTDISQAGLIILAFFGYQPGRTQHALQGWKAIVENCEANEPPVLAYAVLEDAASNTIRTVEIYADAEFASGPHLKSDAVKFNQEQNGADRDGKKGAVKLRPIAGFLGRA